MRELYEFCIKSGGLHSNLKKKSTSRYVEGALKVVWLI